MAQWLGQFSGHTHATKVDELEHALRRAVRAWRVTAFDRARAEKAKSARALAARLYAARLKMFRAAIVIATNRNVTAGLPRRKDNLEALWQREAKVLAQGPSGILVEHGAPITLWLDAREDTVIQSFLRGWPGALFARPDPPMSSEPPPLLTPHAYAGLGAHLALKAFTTFRTGEHLISELASKLTATSLEQGQEAARALVDDLCEEVRRLDLVVALEVHRLASAPIARAMWRSGSVLDDVAPGARIALLDSGDYGLLCRAGERWIWTEGALEEVLPIVPDAHFEAAAMAMITSWSQIRR